MASIMSRCAGERVQGGEPSATTVLITLLASCSKQEEAKVEKKAEQVAADVKAKAEAEAKSAEARGEGGGSARSRDRSLRVCLPAGHHGDDPARHDERRSSGGHARADGGR
jgi:hypothetical protein